MLLPFDGAWWLGTDVVDYPVDSLDLAYQPPADSLEKIVRQPGPVCRHSVVALDGPDCDHILVGALITHHADCPHRKKDRKSLPESFVVPCPADLLGDDAIGPLKQLDP